MSSVNKLNLYGTEYDISPIPEGKYLWTGSNHMGLGETITLSESISEQVKGIELVFSRYNIDENLTLNDDFSHHFVSKYSVLSALGKGHSFTMNDAFFRHIGGKYLTITDNTISGFPSNTESTTANGVTFNNNKWVLRYVIGI